MKKLITMAFRQVRGVGEIFLPEECSPMLAHVIENLYEILRERHADYVHMHGEKGSFYLKFFDEGWVGVSTDSAVNDILIRAALDRTAKFMKKHSQVKQKVTHMGRDIEEYFLNHGVAAVVRSIKVSVDSDSLSGKIQISARKGRTKVIENHINTFLEKELPYFIKNKVDIIIEKQSLIDRITRDQLLRIIRRVERL
jgi:hypothetical protein